MLTTAADYVYNAANLVDDDVIIRGRIIPTEDINGQNHPLRRENFAYLSEALSERYGSAFWSVPARGDMPLLSFVKGWWQEIVHFYTYNPDSGSGGSLYVKPSESFAPVVSASDLTWHAAYAAKLLSVADLPTDMYFDTPPYYLYAWDIRAMFWAINELRRKPAASTIPSGGSLVINYGKSGGSMTADAVLYDNNAADPSAQIPLHQSVSISGDSTSDTVISGSVTGGSGNPITYNYRLTQYELYHYTQASVLTGANSYLNGSEYYYAGDALIQFSYPQKVAATFELLVKFRVKGDYYAWLPVTATARRNNDGDVTAFTFPVDLTWLRSVVQLAYPSATFSYATVTQYPPPSYSVSIVDYAVIEQPDYKSLLPAAWTWTP